MFLTSKESLDERIIILLAKETRSAKWIHNNLGHIQVSTQGLFKALRRLINSNIILKHGTTYTVNSEWSEKIVEKLSNNNICLSEGDRIRYDFSNFGQVDIYWRHLVKNIPKESLKVPPFFYLPHDVWVYLPDRDENLKVYYESFSENRQSAYLVIGNTEAEDIRLKGQLRDKYLHVNTAKYNPFKETEHVAVFDDFITITKLEPIMARKIHNLYMKYSGKEFVKQIKKLLDKKTKIRITLERNAEKAKILKKRISKDFAIPARVQNICNISKAK